MKFDTKIVFVLQIIFVYTVTFLIGMLFVDHTSFSSTIWPASGVAYIYYYVYRKDAAIILIPTMFIFTLVFRLQSSYNPFYVSLIISLSDTVFGFLTILIFAKTLEFSEFRSEKLSNLKEGIKFTIAVIIAAFIGAVLTNLTSGLFFGFSEYYNSLSRWFIGDFIGVMVFGSLLLLSFKRDKSYLHNNNEIFKIIIYVATFIAISYFVFGNMGNNFLTFENFQLAFFVLYIICVFLFTYRMLFVSNLIFLLFFGLFTLPYIPTADVTNQIVLNSLFLVSLSSISSIVKNILFERDQNYLELEHTRDNLESMIVSSNSLFNIENTLPDKIEASRLNYLKDMFELACKIYPKFTKASVNFRNGKYVQFLAVKGYDIDQLNSLNFLSDQFIWTLDEPAIIYGTDYDKALEEEERSNEFIDTYGVLKQSIRFTVKFDEESLAGMSFDLFTHDKESFNEYDLENFRSFQLLMNSYSKLNILNTERNSLKDNLVLSLVRTLELYDSYTGGHSEEVADLSLEISKKLRLEEDQKRQIYWSAIVHDIGKIGIDINILNKKGKLTDQEYSFIKKHPVYGYDILRKTDALKDVAITVRHHHEWWDGSGYPDQLKGMEIPFSSQILHVCDAVSAMAKDRIYKAKLSEKEILEQLQSGVGKQFSPKVAKIMIKFIEQGQLKDFFLKRK